MHAASGTSKISGIEELRYKESDRIMAMENGLRAIGINVHSSKDSIEITGGKITGGKVNSYDDHRIAMSFAIAGLISAAFTYNHGYTKYLNIISYFCDYT